jgi:hypothetical protein
LTAFASKQDELLALISVCSFPLPRP